MGVAEDGQNLIKVSITFEPDGTGMIYMSYNQLCSEEEAEEMAGWGHTIYEVDGKLYCGFGGYGDARDFNYTIENGEISCNLYDGFLYLTRTTDDVLTVLDTTDYVLDNNVTNVVKTAGAFTCEHYFEMTTVKEATCQANGVVECVCAVCGYVENMEVPATRHTYTDGVCTVCGYNAPRCEVSAGEWIIEVLSKDGATLYVTTLSYERGDTFPYLMILQEYYAVEPEESWDTTTYEYQGKTYYGESWGEMWMSANVVEDGDTIRLDVTEKGFEEEILFTVTLKRTGNNQFVVTESAGWTHYFPVGACLICYQV